MQDSTVRADCLMLTGRLASLSNGRCDADGKAAVGRVAPVLVLEQLSLRLLVLEGTDLSGIDGH